MKAKCFRVVGIDRDGGTCECCGKTNLKKLILLREITADGESESILKFGSNCASQAVNCAVSAKSIETDASKVEQYGEKIAGRKIIGKQVNQKDPFRFGMPW